ncbi:MAG: metallophosphoesterase [Candidatus Acidiferrales bacterium]
MRGSWAFMAVRLLFLVAILLITFLIQRFWFARAWGLIESVPRPGWRVLLQGLWIAAAALLFVTVLNSFVWRFLPRGGAASWILAAAKLWLAASFFALLAVRFVVALDWISKHVSEATGPSPRESIDHARRQFFRYAAYLAGSLPFVGGAYGFLKERLAYGVRKIEIPIADLPKGLDGLRIVQLSDVHIGDFMPREEVRRAVDMANALSADLAVVTGDFITSENDPLEDCIAELSRLQAPLGVWGCNGNHEIYADAEAAAQQLFRQYGMRLLRKENAELAWHGQSFNLIGVDYQRERSRSGKKLPMLRGVEPLVRKDVPNILLSHNPNSFVRAAELGIELSLAGHTHGGQVRVEIVDHSFSPARFMTNFTAGLYRRPAGNGTATLHSETSNAVGPQAGAADGSHKSAFLYVNRGLGTIGMPVRIGVPPEITLITLRSAG